MADDEWLAQLFERHRQHLQAVAQRMLGSVEEAEDAVQEAWLRLSRAEQNSITNLGGWLTTVVSRVCLDLLRSRKSRAEEPIDEPEPIPSSSEIEAERELLLGDSIGAALHLVLETLTPAERVAFVLHDLFAVPFADIAPIVERSEAATRQLASRARRRVQGGDMEGGGDRARQRDLVDAFLAASRHGDFDTLLSMLDPDVVLRADAAAVRLGAAAEVRGAGEVAETFKGRARVARLALVNGIPGAVWTVGGLPRVIFGFTIEGGKIVEIDLIADRDRLERAELVLLQEEKGP